MPLYLNRTLKHSQICYCPKHILFSLSCLGSFFDYQNIGGTTIMVILNSNNNLIFLFIKGIFISNNYIQIKNRYVFIITIM